MVRLIYLLGILGVISISSHQESTRIVTRTTCDSRVSRYLESMFGIQADTLLFLPTFGCGGCVDQVSRAVFKNSIRRPHRVAVISYHQNNFENFRSRYAITDTATILLDSRNQFGRQVGILYYPTIIITRGGCELKRLEYRSHETNEEFMQLLSHIITRL